MVKPHEPALVPTGLMNVTDHDSRVDAHARPAAAAGLQRPAGGQRPAGRHRRRDHDRRHRTSGTSSRWSAPRNASCAASSSAIPSVVLADAGYWHQRQIETVVSDGIQVLVPPDAGLRSGATARAGPAASMTSCAACSPRPTGRALYRQRQVTIEPVFGQIKFNRQIRRFQRRGRAGLPQSNGGSSPRPTTSSSSTTTASAPSPPETAAGRWLPAAQIERHADANAGRGSFARQPPRDAAARRGGGGLWQGVGGAAMISVGADRSDGWECAAVDDVFGAGDRGGAVGDEEGDEFGDLFGLGRSSERDPAEGVHDLL